VTDINGTGQTRHTWLIGLGVMLAIAVGVYWAELSQFAYVISRMY
jgi:hypothetical protein